MRESNKKIVEDKDKFEQIFPKYQLILDELIDKYRLSDGRLFADLVNFKTNMSTPKHNWYEYKQGYSEQLVQFIIDKENPLKDYYILDPFCGVGTTNLTAHSNGYKSIGFDINPMAVLAAVVKTHYYLDSEIHLIKNYIQGFELPKMKDNIGSSKVVETSFTEETLGILLKIKYFVESIDIQSIQNFFRLALISIIDDCSLKVKDGNGLKKKKNITPIPDLVNHYLSKCNTMINDLQVINNNEESITILGSIINEKHFNTIKDKKVGLCVFSPPYANCFDYCEVYKLEFWIGGYVKKYSDFEKYRSIAIRSHVNSKFDHSINNFNEKVNIIADTVSTFNIWNKNIPDMLRGYFDDMSMLLNNLKLILVKGAKCYIVVANSGYKGILVPTDLLIADIASSLGYYVNNIYYARKIRSSSQQMDYLNGNYDNLMRESVIEIQYPG